MTRRQAMSVLLALPVAAQVTAQTRRGLRHRVILGGSESMLIGPEGLLHMWIRLGSGGSAYYSRKGLMSPAVSPPPRLRMPR